MPALEEHPQTEHREVDANHVPVDEEQEEERRRDDDVLKDSILAGPDESTHLHGLIDQEGSWVSQGTLRRRDGPR